MKYCDAINRQSWYRAYRCGDTHGQKKTQTTAPTGKCINRCAALNTHRRFCCILLWVGVGHDDKYTALCLGFKPSKYTL